VQGWTISERSLQATKRPQQKNNVTSQLQPLGGDNTTFFAFIHFPIVLHGTSSFYSFCLIFLCFCRMYKRRFTSRARRRHAPLECTRNQGHIHHVYIFNTISCITWEKLKILHWPLCQPIRIRISTLLKFTLVATTHWFLLRTSRFYHRGVTVIISCVEHWVDQFMIIDLEESKQGL